MASLSSSARADSSAAQAPSTPLSVSRRLGRLQFHLSGKFRVLQVADIQEGPIVSKDTIRLIAAACDEARPDVVIFTGNQIKGYDSAFSATFRRRRWGSAWERAVPGSAPAGADGVESLWARHDGRHDGRAIEQTKELVRRQAAQFLAPLIERGIPFAITYGNHDFQCGLSDAELDEIYREFPGCLNPQSDARADSSDSLPDMDPVPAPRSAQMARQSAYACEPGTFALPVWDVPDDDPLHHGVRVSRGVYEEQRGRLDGVRPGEDAAIRASRVDRPVLALACVNSGDYDRAGGYGEPSARAMRWLRALPEELGVKSLVFQHFAVPQTYGLLRRVPATSAGAIQGYGAWSHEAFVLDEQRVLAGSVLGEGISTAAQESGEWKILISPVPAIGAVTAVADVADAGPATRADADPGSGPNGFIGVVSGHDHRNAFAGTLDGLLLAATPTSGFGSYGPPASKRAVRLIEFDARHPWHPRTKLLDFGTLVGGPSSRAVYTFASAHVPVNLQQARDVARRPRNLAGLAAAIAVFAGIGAGLRRVFTRRGR